MKIESSNTMTKRLPPTTVSKWAMMLLVLTLGISGSSTGQAPAPDTVGGHIGVVLPLVTHAGGNTTNLGDRFSIGIPVGITLRETGRLAMDFEFISTIQNSPRLVTLTVDPGLLVKVGHGFTYGTRLAFNVNSTQFGFIPLLNKSWAIRSEGSFFKAYFVEADVPFAFNRPSGGQATNPVTFAMHFGVGF